MKRSNTQLVVFFALLLLAFFIKTRLGRFSENLLTQAREQAAARNIGLEWKSAEVHLPSRLNAKDVSVIWATPWGRFPLKIDSLDGALSLSSLLTLKLATQIDARLYAGNTLLNLKRPALGQDVSGEFSATDLRIENYPLANLWGLRGLLSGNGSFTPQQLDATFKIRDGALSTSALGGGLIKLSPVSDIQASARIEAQAKTLKLQDIDFVSSHGNIQGSGELILNQQSIQAGRVSLTISLSELGVTEISPYLALVGNVPTDSQIAKWNLELDFSAGGIVNPRIRPAL